MNILLYSIKLQSEVLAKAYQKILQNAKNYVEQEVMSPEIPEYAR
jgi:hypothetical protein